MPTCVHFLLTHARVRTLACKLVSNRKPEPFLSCSSLNFLNIFLVVKIFAISKAARKICVSICFVMNSKSLTHTVPTYLPTSMSGRKKSQQHPVFPSGLPSKYYPGPMLLNFSVRTRTGVFNMVWPLTRKKAKILPLKVKVGRRTKGRPP